MNKNENFADITSGVLLDKYPYAKSGHSPKYVIVFPPTGDLIRSVITNPHRQIKKYRRFFSNEYSILILGYPRNLDENDSSCELIADDFSKIINQKLFADNFQNPAIIMGISYGGKIAIPFAAKYPELVEKLIILMSAHQLSDQGVDFCRECVDFANRNKRLQLLLQFNRLYTSPLLKRLMDYLTRLGWFVIKRHLNHGSTLANAYQYMLTHNQETQKYLPDIKAQSLVVGAENDLLFTANDYRETAKRIPKGNVHIIKGCNHVAAVERPTECISVIKSFLR